MELTIEKLIYGGEGLAHLPADERGKGKAVFVPFVLPGERVEGTIVENKPGFARASLEKILEPAPGRAAPGCPYFTECGGCQYQHISYPQQLQSKMEILRETLRRIAKIDIPGEIALHPSEPWNYRNRARMQVRHEPEFALGYYRFASHELLPVRECPISSQLINRALAKLWALGEAGKVPAAITEIEFFADADDSALLLELTLPGELRDAQPAWKELADFARSVRQHVPEIAGVVPFHAASGKPDSLPRPIKIPKEHAPSFGAEALKYRTKSAQYRVAAGSFFQANRFLVDEMVNLVTGDRSGGFALDMYAGVGLFSLALAKNFRQVAAVESAPASFRDLKSNAPPNVRAYQVAAHRFLAEVPPETRFDYVVVDPPRGGLGENAAMAAAKLKAPQFTYVSCDPATLARDLRVMTRAGYRITRVHLLDLFPQTFHIETVVQLEL